MATTKQPKTVDKRTLEVILTDQQEELEMRRDDRLCHRVRVISLV